MAAVLTGYEAGHPEVAVPHSLRRLVPGRTFHGPGRTPGAHYHS
jgi:hypothetical protein